MVSRAHLLAGFFSTSFLVLAFACGDSGTADGDDGGGTGGAAPVVMTDAEAITRGCETFGSTAAIRTASATAEGAQAVGFEVLYLVSVPAGGGYLKLDTQHKGPYGIFLDTGIVTGASLAGPGEAPSLATLCGTSPSCGCKADAGYRVELVEGSFTIFLASTVGGEAQVSFHDLTKSP